ncbi:MAG: hypothetical protein LBE12_15185 [Planctomycetaceae bacterium]|jgi:hypothetical protein|nr:hypothetical protein [Planctomycetaceae bacterium]
MPVPINIKPEIIRWALERSRLEEKDYPKIFETAHRWITGQKKPTWQQLTNWAKEVMVPHGYLFLNKPPQESLPITDFRTFKSQTITAPSPNLLNIIYNMQTCQEWMHEIAMADEYDTVGNF